MIENGNSDFQKRPMSDEEKASFTTICCDCEEQPIALGDDFFAVEDHDEKQCVMCGLMEIWGDEWGVKPEDDFTDKQWEFLQEKTLEAIGEEKFKKAMQMVKEPIQ